MTKVIKKIKHPVDKQKKWDVFISHASEDKQDLVQPLALALTKYGAKVWYDELTLKIGDSLSRSIDTGLINSDYGVVILSPCFFAKGWPEYELKGLTTKEVGNRPLILPIWHNVNKEIVMKYSLTLADKKAILSKDASIEEIALNILAVIRPDIFMRIHKRMAYEEIFKKAKRVTIKTEDICFGPIIHAELPSDLISRIRLIRAALLGVHTHSMAVWVDGFKRDAYPSKEIAWWEHLASCYLEIVRMEPLTKKQVKEVFAILLLLLNNSSVEKISKQKMGLSKDLIQKIQRIIKYKYPIYDIKEDMSHEFDIDKSSQEIYGKLAQYFEEFPKE